MKHKILSGKKTSGRLHLLDVIRGITLLSMMAYHASWDLVYIAGINWPWYHTKNAFYWQQSICWTFILLSGLCNVISRNKWKRGLVVFGAGALVTAATLIFMPQDRVVFGVLTFIGSAMLIMAFLWRSLEVIPAIPGALVCAYLFYVFRNVNAGYLTFYPGQRLGLPGSLYHGQAATFLGFMDPNFFSTDYFSLLPWIFLYVTGYFLGLFMKKKGILGARLFRLDIPPLSFVGRNSLLIYMLHQPIIYMIIVILMRTGLL